MQYDKLYALETWFGSWRDRISERWIRLAKRLGRWRNKLTSLMLIPLLLTGACTPIVAEQAIAEPTPTEAAEIVVCLGVVRDTNGWQHGFLQRGSETLEQTFAQQGMQQLLDGGFTVEHRNCYDSWQKAADFLTNGAVTLPENATEEDFVAAMIEWQQMQYNLAR